MTTPYESGVVNLRTGPLAEEWRAAHNNIIGGWCIALACDTRTPADGAVVLVDMICNREVADHIARMHNDWIKRSAAQ